MADLELKITTKIELKEKNKSQILQKTIEKNYKPTKDLRIRGTLAVSAASVAIGFGAELSSASSLQFTPSRDMALRIITATASAQFGVASGAPFLITRSHNKKIISLEATNQDHLFTTDYDLIVGN